MAGEYCAIYGSVVKPPMAHNPHYHWRMRCFNYRRVLAENVQALMDATPELSSHKKLANRCAQAGRKIGARTIGHLLNFENGPQPQLDTIVAIALAFKVRPGDLLDPAFDPLQKTPQQPPASVLELSKRIMDLSPQRHKLLLDIFQNEGVRDDALEIRAPQLHIQEPKLEYRTTRQKKA